MKQRNKFSQWAFLAGVMAFLLPGSARAQGADDPILLGLNMQTNHSVTMTEEDGEFTVVTTGGDPYIAITGVHRDLTPGERALTFEYTSNRTVGVEIFFSTSASAGDYAAGKSLVLGNAPATTEWESVTIDLSTPIDDWEWGKAGYHMRLDPGADAGIIFRVRNIRILEQSVDGADLSKYNFTLDEDKNILINSQAEFDNWVRGCNDFISSLYVPKMGMKLNTDVVAAGTEGSLIENFRGVIDGQGHTITMDMKNETKCFGLGLVRYLEGTIKNTRFSGTLEGNGVNIAPIAMDLNQGAMVENIYCDVNIISHTQSQEAYHGGLFARTPGGVVRNVIFAGKISDPEGGAFGIGGIAGQSGATAKTDMQNVIMAGDLSEVGANCGFTISTSTQNTVGSNIFATTDIKETPGWCTIVTPEELASGRFCFMFNGDQKNMAWYQTLGSDPMPTLDATHKKVYANGEYNCDGTPKGEGAETFNNEAGSTIPDHQYKDGVCEHCGQKDPDYVDVLELEQDAEGNYLIASAEDLMAFARGVNGDTFRKANVKLTADIDLSGYGWIPIGYTSLNYGSGQAISEIGYGGTFDGQGHTIYNASLTDNQNFITSGIFGTLTGTVRNLGVSGYEINRAMGGRHGAFCGVLVEGTIENCYVIESTVVHPTNGEIFALMAAGNYGGTIRNCYEFDNTIENHPRAGHFVGDNRDDSSVRQGKVINCYSQQSVTGEGRSGGYAGGKTNCEDNVSVERFESGEIAYKLNGSTFTANPAWRQELGAGYPSLDPELPIIVVTLAGTTLNVSAEDGLGEFASAIAEEEYEIVDELVCQKELAEQYVALIEQMESGEFDEEGFAALLNEMTARRDVLKKNADAYETYSGKVDEVAAYLEENDNFDGPAREKLEKYLTQVVEPDSALFPNGSYEYIMEHLLLPDASLANEKTFVQTLLDEAIATGYQPGADVTNMIANADFANGNIGWAVNTMNTTTVADAEVKYVGESAVALNIRQTITGLRPGLYQVNAYAAYRADGNNQNLNHASFVFAGESQTYASVLMEEMVGESDYADKYTAVTDIEGNPVGYIPTNATAMAYAFSEGLYRHVLVAEVGPDSTLTIGVRTPGCQTSNTTWVGPFTMQYLGAADSEFAAPALSKAIRCQQSHLATLAQKYPEFCADNNNYKAAPNYSSALAARVAAAATAPIAGDNAAMMEQTAQLAAMMQEVYDTKTAYAAMMMKAEVIQEISSEMAIAGLVTPEEGAIMDNSYATLTNAYLDGAYSLEEALNVNPFEGVGFMPKQEGDVIQIGSAKELIMFSAMVNGGMAKDVQAQLTADIDMEGIEFFPPIAYSDPAHNGAKAYDINFVCFTGVFDGKGHSIKNLTAAYNANYWASGVFGNNQGVIRNLIVDNYRFEFGDRAAYSGRHAALCGVNYGLIENCAVINSVVDHSGEIVSGIAAGNYDGTVRACFEARNRINPYPRAGLVVGDNRDDNNNRKGIVEDCFSSSFVTGEGRENPYLGTQIRSHNNVTFSTGEVAWLLNQANEGHPECMTWKQTIGEDATPVLDQTHLDVLNTAFGYSNYDGFDNELNNLLQKANGMITKLTFNAAGSQQEGSPLVLDASQLSSNCQWDGNYDISNILNGEPNKYFHSNPNGTGPNDFSAGRQWMQIDLDVAIVGFHMEYSGRSDGPVANKWHDTPNKVAVWATNTPDIEDSWTQICVQEYPEIPNQNGAYFHTKEPIMLDGAYKHIRLNVLQTTTGNLWWNIVTFQMYAAGAVSGQSYADEHPEILPAVEALQEQCTLAAAKVASRTGTEQDVQDLKAAIAVLRALIPDSVIKFEGTQDEPILISNLQELTAMRRRMKPGQITYFRLTEDIDMAEVEEWTPINTATDGLKNFIDFDGDGHVIRNFTCTTPAQQYNSFFGVLCGNVRNVGFENATVDCVLSGTGILAGYIGHDNYVIDGQQPTSEVYNVWVSGSINTSSSYAGGLFGNVGGPAYLKNVYANVAVTGSGDNVGGLIGRVRDKLTIKQAYAAGTINKGGGIIGGGQQESTPAATYQNIVVWNNTDDNFGHIKSAFAGPVGNLPQADVFELQVNADGTVADKSAMANTIEVMGDMEVKYNQQFGTYSYVSKANGDAAVNFLKIDYSANEALKAAITDGFAMECIFAINDEYSTGKKPFCATEGGGFGIELLGNTNTLQTPLHTDVDGTKGYKSANVTDIKVQPKKFYHAVAVYNAQTGKNTLYVNGFYKAEVSAPGIVHFPDNAVSQWIGIGADPSGSENVGQAAGNFEIVAARIYNEPITEAQAKALYLTQFSRTDLMDGDTMEGISYFNGDNFADLQSTVVGWGDPWQCGMAQGEYPTFDPGKTAIGGIKAQPKAGRIYNINGIEVEKAQNGIFIIDGKKVMVK